MNLYRSERVKSFRWYFLIIPVVLSLAIALYFFGAIYKYGEVALRGNNNPWPFFIHYPIGYYSFIVLPVLMAVIAERLCRIEGTAIHWQQLRLLPVSNSDILMSKLIYMILYIAAGLLVLPLLLYLAGTYLHTLKPSLGFSHPPSVLKTSLIAIQSFAGAIPLIFIHFYVGLRLERTGLHLGLAAIAGLVGLFISNSPVARLFWPWSYPVIFGGFGYYPEQVFGMSTFGKTDFTNPVLIAPISAVCISALFYYLSKRYLGTLSITS